MKKHLLSKSTYRMLVGVLGVVGGAAMPLSSAQAVDAQARVEAGIFGEGLTEYQLPSWAETVRASQAPYGAQGPMRSGMADTAARVEPGIFGEGLTEYQLPTWSETIRASQTAYGAQGPMRSDMAGSARIEPDLFGEGLTEYQLPTWSESIRARQYGG